MIVAFVAAVHLGHVTVCSEANEGTIVRMTLPLIDEA
jgi:hypothetical protein